ncbi:MAG: hypothetical protein GX039_05105, partial [Clostridia bacterium]|nr:hypothetical protein [Clostridia bacterium]
ITAVLVNFDSYRTRRVEKTRTYILKPRQDGSLYFVSGHQEYVNNNLVRLEGNYRRFDKIAGFEGNLSELSMLGENDGRIIFANTPYDKNKNATLILLNPASMKLEQELDTGVNFSRTDVRLNGDKIVVCLNDKIIVIDKSLKERAEVSLPQGLKDKIEREPQYDQYGFPDVYFGGYDVSSDFKRFVYADEQGLKLINIADSSEILLAPTVPITGSKLLKNYYHSSPRFVADGQKVISTLLGYESAVGYTLCNLEEGTYRTYDFASEAASTAFIRYDTGLLEINTYIRPNGKQTGEYKTLFLDFYTGEVKEIELKDPGETGYIVFPEACYVGLDYAAFITCEFDDNDYANNMSYLNRLNLKTLAVEDKIVTVKAANTSILGVLADGRILFWYSLNPSEEGIGITE